MGNSFKTLISESKSILILLPKNPDFDSVAAGTSLYLALKQIVEKDINICCESPMTVEFNNLVGVDRVKNEISNKNLCLTFQDYDPQGIETVGWEIEDAKFKLTVVPKANVPPPNQDQVLISYSGISVDLIILVGGKEEEDFSLSNILQSTDEGKVKLSHVGVKTLQVTGRPVASLETQASSVSEVAANIIKDSGGIFKLEQDIATNLLMGIEKATDTFKVGLISADTFALVSELMKNGGKRLQEARLERPFSMSPTSSNIPPSWTEPKIFKGASIS